MAQLRVPVEFRRVLEELAAFDESQWQVVMQTLQTSLPSLSRAPWSRALASQLSGIDMSRASETVDALVGLCATSLASDLDVSRFVESLFESQMLGGVKPKDPDAFRKFLVQLLSLPSLVVVAKALDVLTSHQRIYLNGRVFTDIRPVFGPEIRQGPTAAVIVHTLRIGIRDGRETTEFYVALDSNDIRRLQEVLRRAQEKEATIVSAIKAQGLKYLPVEEIARNGT